MSIARLRRFRWNPFGPVLRWELVTQSRPWRFFALRSLFATVVLFCLWASYQSVFSYLTTMSVQEDELSDVFAAPALYSAFAAEFSQWMTIAQVLAIYILTPAIIASALAMERERKTIEYLFASDLTNAEIVFGKIFARSAVLIVVLMSSIPVVALAGIFGGIDFETLPYILVSELSLLFSTAALSLVVSMHCRSTRQAIVMAYVWVILAGFLPLVGSAIFWSAGILLHSKMPDLYDLMITLTPGVNLPEIIANASIVNTVTFFMSIHVPEMAVAGPFGRWTPSLFRDTSMFVAGQVLWGSLLLGYVLLRLRSSYRFDVAKPSTRLEDDQVVRGFRRPKLWEDYPLLWKESFVRGWHQIGSLVRVLIGSGVGLFYVLFFVGFLSRSGRADNFMLDALVRFASVVGPCIIALFLAFRSATAIVEEKDRDCWESLLATPLSDREIIWSKFLGTMYGLRWMFYLLLPPWAGAVWAGVMPWWGAILAASCTLGVAVLIAGSGLLASLSFRSAGRAIGGAVAIPILFWIALQNGMFGVHFLAISDLRGDDDGLHGMGSTVEMWDSLVSTNPLGILGFLSFGETPSIDLQVPMRSLDGFLKVYMLAFLSILLHVMLGLMMVWRAERLLGSRSGRVPVEREGIATPLASGA